MLDKTQDIVEFAQDKITALYDKYKDAAPGEYDGQVIGGVIAITKHLLDTAVKIEALDKLTHLKDMHGATNMEAVVDIYRVIFGSES